ncbi:3-dehydroshikimate dehydratase [Xylaria cf. heliscus]|nr:3-dehydroshikimate dehydratase [Xylaria cf. heliscus]
MPIDYQGAKVPTSYATCSIGHKATHTLPEKLKAISSAGFDGIELSMPDILSYAAELHGQAPDPSDYAALASTAATIRSLAEARHLKIMMLQPFAHFEGWPRGSSERDDAFARARGWLRVVRAADTDMLQVGSSDAAGISDDVDVLAADLAELADLCAEQGVRVAYENWCWATRAPAWKDVWGIVERAGRENLGLCLDTFQSAGGEWGDPRTRSGVREGVGDGGVDGQWRESLRELVATVPPEKIFLLQISDAYKMDPPLDDEDEQGLRPRARWSHDFRPLPFDGGYLPVKEFLDAVLETGFRGWLSVEVFDGRAGEKYEDMGEYCKKAMASLRKLLDG